VELDRVEGMGAGHAEDVLGEDVEAAGDGVLAVLRALLHRLERRLAFEHLEAVGGDE
jgi:hypothetical protein